MADGSMGNLWFNLGIKDTTPQTLNRILRAVSEADGSVSKLRENFNKLLQGLKQEDAEALSKGFNKSVKNAMSYFEMLMRIENEQKRLASLKSVNNGINKQGLIDAENMLKTIKRDLLDLQHTKFGGVDAANLEPYAKALGNVIKNVKSIEDSFKKENSLSVAANNAERLKIKLEQVKNTLADIYNRQSSGMRDGFDTRWLLSAGNSLRGVKRRIETMLTDDKLLLNESKFKSLISDIAYAFEKARGKVAEYNRERSKTIAQEKLINDKAENRRRLDNGEIAYYARIRDILAQIDALNKSISTPLMNASRMGLSVSPSIGEDLRKLYSIKQILETNIAAGRNMGLDWLKNFLGRNGFSEITRELRQFSGNIDDARSKYERLFDILNRLRVERSRSNVLGIDTTKIDEDISRVIERLKILRGIIQTGIGNVGDISGIDGRSLRLLERDASAQKRLNDEKERSNNLERRHQDELARTGAKIQSQLVKGFKDANNAAGRLNSTVQDLKSLFMQGGLVFGAQQFAMSIIRTGGEMEKQHIAMQSILGDMQNANTMFNQTKELALQSPFTFSELNRDVKQLAAYGVEYENLYDTTKRLADMASGLGVSFERIALAFGQVQARGWLDGKELRQIAYAGIPLLDRLSKYYSQREGKKVTTSDVKGRITNREVSFQDVKNIFWEMTDAGGQFYNMQLTLSETLLGRYNKLKDAWEIMLADFARGDSVIGGTFKWVLDLVTSLVQQMHTLGPVMTAAFAGFAIKKGITSFGNGGAANFLSNKANLANNIQAQLAQGKQISQIERQILLTKNQITNADLRSLIAYQNINKQELRRLYLSGAITTQQYKTSLALMKHVALTNAATASTNNYALSWRKVGVAGMLALNGIGNAIKGFWAAIGGLPGLIVTAATMGIMTIVSKYQDLTQKIKQTQDEILDRRKQVADFTSQNNIAKAVASGDKKEIDNLIESYKEKLKELAPYDYSNLLMKAEEKKSHEERLKYLEQELKLIDKANKANANRFADNGAWYEDLLGITGKGRDSYSEFMSVINDINKSASSYLLSQAKANAFGATSADKTMFNLNKNGFLNYAQKVKDYIAKEFGDISKDENLRRQAIQAMNNIFSAMGVSAENANLIRASVLQAFGIGNDGWLSGEVGKRMSDLISERFPEIALKIKSDQSLNDGEKKKVQELMKDAKSELINQYPIFSTTLQNLLDQSNFTAVIHLVTQSYGGVFNNLQKELSARIPQLDMGIQSDIFSLYSSKAETWGKENSWYAARNKAKEEIDKARNEYESAKKSNAPDVNDKYTEYDRLKRIALDLLNYDYEGELKKSNKEPKGSKEDEELKALRERIDAFKAFRQMYQKAKEVMPKDKAKGWAYGLFPEMKDLNPEDYIGSIEKLKKGFNFALSPERKKALTSLNREIGDWKISELLKPEFEKAAANFKEALDTQMKQWDLYKTLLEKTGNENFANLAFRNGGIFDEQAKNLVRLFEADYNMKFPGIYANDGDAKKSLEGIAGAYERWKAIADLVRNNYVKYLQDGADAVEKTLTYAQQLDAIDAKYATRINNAKLLGNTDLVDRLNFLKNQEKSSVLLQQAKSEINWDGVFGNLDNYTRKKLKVFRKKLSIAVSKGLTDGMTTEDLQSLYEGITRLDEKIYGGTITGLGELVKELVAASKEYDDSVKEYKKALKEYGPNDYRTQNALKKMNSAENSKNRSQGLVSNKKGDILGNITAIGDMFRALGSGNGSGSALLGNAGAWTTSIMNMFGADKNSSKIGGIVGMFAGLTEVIGEKGFGGFLSDAFEDIGNAVNSIFNDMFGINLGLGGADYSKYEDAKAEYENLIGVWDTLISRKQEYMNVHWGSEAQKAIEEQRKLLESEIEQTKIIARARLDSGASIGSHSIWYRMWQGSYGYQGKNWRDVAPEISRKYGVKFTNMEDMLNMSSDVLQQIMMDYSGLWAMMDDDFKGYLEKLIEYGDKADDILETEIEKLTGNKFSDMVSSWADAMGTMANYSDALVDDFENKLKNVILNSMIEEMYGDAIKSVLKQATEFAKNSDKVYGEGNKVMSEYTKEEYDIIMGGVETLADDIEATREILRSLYGWTDNSSSSGRSSIKNITEDTADLILSYVNAIRSDCSVTRENVRQIAQYVSSVPELSAISRSQLQRLDSIAENTLRNADMATEIRDLFKAVTNGTKKISVS